MVDQFLVYQCCNQFAAYRLARLDLIPDILPPAAYRPPPTRYAIDAWAVSCDTNVMERDGETTDRQGAKAALGAWLRLARVFQKIERASAEQFAAYGLSAAQFDILAQLGRNEGISQQELADRLLVTKGNISQLIGKMEERGLIFRCHEGRANALFLTEEGKRLRQQAVPAEEAHIAARFHALSTSERRTLLRLLRRLDHGLE